MNQRQHAKAWSPLSPGLLDLKGVLNSFLSSKGLRIISVLCWDATAAPEEILCCVGAKVRRKVTRSAFATWIYFMNFKHESTNNCYCFLTEYWDYKFQQQLGGWFGFLCPLSHLFTCWHPLWQPQPSWEGITTVVYSFYVEGGFLCNCTQIFRQNIWSFKNNILHLISSIH